MLFRSAEGLESDTDRLNMCRLAFCDKRFEVSDIEIKRDTDSYTVYTLREIKKMYPDDDLYLIVGSDMLLMFSRWYEYREILSMCTLCVASRCEEESLDELRRYSENELKIPIDGLTGKGIIISPVEPFEISSTELRKLLRILVAVSENFLKLPNTVNKSLAALNARLTPRSSLLIVAHKQYVSSQNVCTVNVNNLVRVDNIAL